MGFPLPLLKCADKWIIWLNISQQSSDYSINKNSKQQKHIKIANKLIKLLYTTTTVDVQTLNWCI